MEGQKFLREIGLIHASQSDGYATVLINGFIWATGPLAGSRKDVVQKYERMMDLAEANVRRPLREVSWEPYLQDFYEVKSAKIPDPVANAALPLSTTQQRAELFLGHRDGILVGIALELYRRKNGEYPKTLDTLVPQYLPQIFGG